MNIVNLVGIFFALGVMLFAMLFENENPRKLLDPHGAVIVIGGTIACVGVAYGIDKAFKMIVVFYKRLFTDKLPTNKLIIKELMGLAESYRTDAPDLEQKIQASSDPFMKECMTALTEKVLEDKKLFRVLTERVNTMYERYNDDAKMFTSCGKFPPAMGLMGAVLGMIALLGSLGKPGAEKNIGPAMSVALVATLYGIAFANLFVIPIGEHLGEIAKKLRLKNRIIVEGVRHIAKKVNPVELAEELNSFLIPSERIDWKNLK